MLNSFGWTLLKTNPDKFYHTVYIVKITVTERKLNVIDVSAKLLFNTLFYPIKILVQLSGITGIWALLKPVF